MADWLKPRQHICVALATVCWTGADHWIQMWKSFGVPMPISWTQLSFFPLWILELGYNEMRLGKSNLQPLHPIQAASGGRNSEGGNSDMIQNKRPHVVKTFSLTADPFGEDTCLPESIFECVLKRIKMQMIYSIWGSATVSITTPANRRKQNISWKTGIIKCFLRTLLSNDLQHGMQTIPLINMNGLVRQDSQRACSDWILRGFGPCCGEEFVVKLSWPAFPLVSPHDTVTDRSVKGISQNQNCCGQRGQHLLERLNKIRAMNSNYSLRSSSVDNQRRAMLTVSSNNYVFQKTWSLRGLSAVW